MCSKHIDRGMFFVENHEQESDFASLEEKIWEPTLPTALWLPELSPGEIRQPEKNSQT